jgi:UDP-galactopyranose mutase
MIQGAVPETQGEPGVIPGMPLPAVRVPSPTSPRLLPARAFERARAKPASRRLLPTGRAFRSFWMGGYDDQAHPGLRGDPEERMLFRENYGGLLEFGIRTVRENADWARVDTTAGHDLRPLEERARMAKDLGMQVVWTLCSRRWPADVHFLSSAFVERFARYAGAVAARMAEFDPGTLPVFVPVNEISFLAWSLFSRGDLRRKDGTRPALEEIKRQLVRASIAASDAILAKVPHARLMHTDPLEHVVAPLGRPMLAPDAERRTELQYEAWDWIAGRSGKDLGGRARYLDLVGVNYYADNQWELGTGKRLGWQIDDVRRMPLSSLLRTVGLRYQRPVAIAETSHTGIRRAAWIREIAAEVRTARQMGIRIEGVCLYPLIDRIDGPYAASLRAAQKTVGTELRAPSVTQASLTAG